MAGCGDKFRFMARTSNGRTLDDPVTPIIGATAFDAAAWRELAASLTAKAHAELARLGKVETAKGKGYPKWNALIDSDYNMRKADSELGDALWSFVPGMVEKCIGVVELALCQLEQVDDALQSYNASGVGGGPKPETGWWDKTVPWLILGGMGVGGYVAYRKGYL